MKPYGSKRQDRGRFIKVGRRQINCRCCPDKAGRWCKRRERQAAAKEARDRLEE